MYICNCCKFNQKVFHAQKTTSEVLLAQSNIRSKPKSHKFGNNMNGNYKLVEIHTINRRDDE